MFIVFEGGEGCGKTTLRSLLAEFLVANGYSVTQTREPGGTPLSEEIRGLLLTPRDEVVDVQTEALLFFAARRQHVESVIKPKLLAGNIVISDRFMDSTYALQCHGGSLPEETYNSLVKLSLGDFKPDVTILLDLDPEISFKGVRERGTLDRMEMKGLEYHQRVRQGFLEAASKDPSRYLVLKAHRDVNEMLAEIIDFTGL